MTTDGGLPLLLKEKIIKAGGDATRIETGMTGRGIPDLNYCLRGREGWIECKKCQANTIHFRPEQIAWAEKRLRAGGRVFGAIRQMNSGDLFLIHGSAFRVTKLDTYPPLGRWAAPWNWAEVLKVLVS